jgi:hypothetical protein
MAQVSEMLVAKKPRRARAATKEESAQKKTDAAIQAATPVGGIGQ